MSGFRIRVKVLVVGSVLVALVLAGCGAQGEGGAPPSLMKPAIDHPYDKQIHYRDEESRHVISLFDDGTYRFESEDLYGGPLGSREGRWEWKKGGSHKAELTLDTDQWILTFASPDDAMAVNLSAPGHTRAFHFEQM